MLVIAISTLTLFTRALQSNISGGRSSQLSTFVGADIEAVNQTPVDQDAWSVAGTAAGVLDLPARFWDTGRYYESDDLPNHIGDEKWVTSVGDADGPILWSRAAAVRKYSLSDISIIISSDAAVLVTGGAAGASPMLFDNPLTNDANAHITEFRVSITEQRGQDGATGKYMKVGHFRAF